MRFTIVMTLVFFQLATKAQAEPTLEQLTEWMCGSFSSQAQAEADSSYFDISLEMKRIWTDREDGSWIYVEQAVSTHLERPYRQRVYHVTQDGMDFLSGVYSFDDPLRFAGDWKSEEPLKGLTVDSLQVRKGCAVLLNWFEEEQCYRGSTNEKDCESTLRGAQYATSEVTVKKDRVLSWDRGFDADDEHVWGAEYAGYEFLRK